MSKSKVISMALTYVLLILVSSAISVFARPGDLDPSFGNGGKVITGVGSGLAMASAFQADGRILLAGYAYVSTGGSDFVVVRYNPDGTLDTTFGVGGIVQTELGERTFDKAASIAIQPDGKIVVAGQSMESGPNYFICDFAVVRYNPDGSLDTSFDHNGIVTTRLPGFYSGFPAAVSIQADGKVVVAGDRSPAGTVEEQVEGGDEYTFVVVRYNADGSLDTTFDNDGVVYTNASNITDDATSAVIQPDGKIIVGGSGLQWLNFLQNILVRYNPDGSLDAGFGTDGVVITSPPPGFEYIALDQIALQADGKIVGAGAGRTTSPSQARLLVTRYAANGSLDVSFSNDGFVDTPIGSYGDGNAVTIQPNGKIIAAGMTSESGLMDFAAARYHPDGSLDAGFGTGGIVTTAFGNDDDFAYSAAIQPDGRIVLAGSTYDPQSSKYDYCLARYNGDAVSAGRAPFDFDGDSKTDISVFRPTTGEWYLNRSQAGFFGTQFGFGTDRIAPADYDGDGKSDIAVYRPSDGVWYITNSSNGVVDYRVFGLAADLPTPADYDGDGKADISVFRPSTGTWYRTNSSNGSFSAVNFGVQEDKPTIGDFDGDGKADIGVWRPSTGSWYRINSSNGLISGVGFGISTDLIVPADYDGDGKADLSVFRPSTGTWYMINSSSGTVSTIGFGLSADIPAPGDFDGDGKADLSVFRPSDGTWYIANSGNGSFTIFPWGLSGDRPTPSAFRY